MRMWADEQEVPLYRILLDTLWYLVGSVVEEADANLRWKTLSGFRMRISPVSAYFQTFQHTMWHGKHRNISSTSNTNPHQSGRKVHFLLVLLRDSDSQLRDYSNMTHTHKFTHLHTRTFARTAACAIASRVVCCAQPRSASDRLWASYKRETLGCRSSVFH